MADPVVGATGVVGFGLNDYNNKGRDEGVYELIASVDRSTNTQAILAAIRHDNGAVRDAIQANAVAIEKTAAATNLAIEKVAAAAALKNAECCCEIKSLIFEQACQTREMINALEASHLKDALAAANQELLIRKLSSGGHGNGKV